MSRTGVVTAGVAPVRRAPDHASEQVTQCLLGERFDVEEESADGAWWAVRLAADGYRGWLRRWYGRLADGESSDGEACVDGALVEVRAAPRRRAPLIALLPWQARVRAHAREGAWRCVSLPSGESGFVPVTAISQIPIPGGPATPARLLRTAARWMGSPYLWGGRTPSGFDCSGLVQAVWAWHGAALPRDARDQQRAVAAGARRRTGGSPPGATAKPGDLLFFGDSPESVTHVGIAGPSGEFIHAYGRVCRGSLNETSERFVPELVSRFIGAWPVRLSGASRRAQAQLTP